MDLNDPRRRLQAAQQASPSIRISAGPVKTPNIVFQDRATPGNVSVQNGPATPRVFTGGKEIQAGNGPANEIRNPGPSLYKTLGNFVQPITNEFAKFGNEVGAAGVLLQPTRAGFQERQDAANRLLREGGGLGHQGGVLGGAEGSGESVYMGKNAGTNIAKTVGTGGTIGSVVAGGGEGTLLKSVVGGGISNAVGSVGTQLAENQKVNAKQTAIDTGLGAFFGAGGRIVGQTFRKIFGKGTTPAVSATATDIAQAVTDETNPSAISKALGVNADTAEYLATETNKEVVQQVLHSMALDPNIKMSPDLRQRLQDSGVTAVNVDPNSQYPAEYNPNNQTVSVKSPADATNDALYHELGHSLFFNKLTPEEQAAFQGINGQAARAAAGRPGYTAKELASEDFSDFVRKALDGRIDEVPESVRPIVAKYAKVAEKQAPELSTFPRSGTKSFAPLTPTTKNIIKSLGESANQTPRIPGTKRVFQAVEDGKPYNWVFDDADTLAAWINGHSTPGMTAHFYDVPPDMLKPTRNGDHVFTIGDNKPVSDVAKTTDTAQATPDQASVEAMSKAASGTADAPMADGQGNIIDNGTIKTPGRQFNANDQGVAEQVNTNADAAAKTQTAEELFPNMDPESRAAVQEVMDSLGKAKSDYNVAAKARKTESAQRIQAGNAAYEAAGGGEAGVRAKQAALAGKKTASNFEPIQVSEKSQTAILDDIEKSDLMDYEKLNTQNAFRKLWGAKEEKPAPHDIKSIKNYFNQKEAGLGDEVAKQIEEAANSGQTLDTIVQLAGIPRTLMTIADASAPRQLAAALTRHPIIATRNYLKSFEHMFSGKKFDAATTNMEKLTDPEGKNYYEFMDTVMNMHLPNVAEKAAEEQMSSAPILSKIPGVGRVVDASNRGMSSAVAQTRFDLARKFIDDAGGVEKANELFSKKELSDLGEVLNTITGRGGKKGGFTDRHSKILSQTLFSGKLWASRMNMLNPYWYYRLSGPARKEALSSAASFAASAGTVLALISQLPGVEVGTDPTSADFAKIRVGNTRFDILGGFQQNIRVAAQIATGTRTNSETGDSKPTTAASVLGGLIEGKANPLLGYAYKLMNTLDNPDSSNPLDRKDEWGNDMNAGTEGAKLFVPLNISGIAETAKDTGSWVKGAAMSVPGFFGAGVQTYGNNPTKDQAKDGTYNGKVTPEMVTDYNGKPLLNDKGQPVKVKFAKDATDLEKQAVLTKARENAYRNTAKRNMNKDDRAIYKMGEADPTQLDAAQKAKYDRLKKYVEDYGKPSVVPAEVTSDVGKGFYSKWNSMTKTDQENWLKQTPDENSKNVANIINPMRAKGLSEFKPSNGLAKAYAEFEKDINSHPEYTELDKLNKTKAFQTFAYKLNYSAQQQKIFKEGPSADLKSLISQKQISQKDLDEAIKMDNELYTSGLTGTLKFSKKFRREYGYGIPADKGGSGGGGSGGSGSTSKRTYLANALPNFNANSGGAMPTVRTTPKRTKLSFKNVNLPKASPQPKVNIKL